MEWLLWMLAVAVLGLGAVAGSGRWGGLPDTVRDAPLPKLPDGPLTADDLAGLQFEVVTRGYSMAQVDEVLDRLQRQLPTRGPAGGGDAAAGAVLGASAIMDADMSQQDEERRDDGSNEAPHR